MYICGIHTCGKYSTATGPLQEQFAAIQWIFGKGASSACFSLFSNAQAWSNKWLELWKTLQGEMAQQKQSPLQVIQFLRLTYLSETPLL